MAAIAVAHPDKRVTLWFEDEARIGQKGCVCHRCWTRGQRPPGLCDQRYASWVHIFAAVRPATGGRGLRPRAAARLVRGDERVPPPLRRNPPARRARHHGPRRRQLARQARHPHPRQRQPRHAAALLARADPRRARLALPPRDLPLAPPPRRLRRRRRSLLSGLVPTHACSFNWTRFAAGRTSKAVRPRTAWTSFSGLCTIGASC